MTEDCASSTATMARGAKVVSEHSPGTRKDYLGPEAVQPSSSESVSQPPSGLDKAASLSLVLGFRRPVPSTCSSAHCPRRRRLTRAQALLLLQERLKERSPSWSTTSRRTVAGAFHSVGHMALSRSVQRRPTYSSGRRTRVDLRAFPTTPTAKALVRRPISRSRWT